MKRRSCRSIALTSLLFSLIVLLSFPVIAQEDAEEATDASPVVAPAATVQESDTDEPAIPMVSVQAEADEDAPEQPVYRQGCQITIRVSLMRINGRRFMKFNESILTRLLHYVPE